MIFHSWEHRRRLRLTFDGERAAEIGEIRSSRKQERARVIAILHSALALGILFPLGFSILFLYSVNEDDVSEARIAVMAAPFILNAVQLLMGIILLCITKKDTRHLGKCRKWCFAAKLLSGFILFELFILLHWQFRTLAFGLFGIQYLLRVAAIHKVKRFMEDLIARNPAIRMAAISRENFPPPVIEVTPAVPLHSTTTPSSLPGYYELDIRVDPATVSPQNAGLRAVPAQANRNASPNSEISATSSFEEQDKLPSYIEAMESLKLTRSKNTVSGPVVDPPPSYNEAVNIN